jgi:hypothetical protein
MGVCRNCGGKLVIGEFCSEDCQTGRRGVKNSELFAILKQQGGKCPLSGKDFIVRFCYTKKDKILYRKIVDPTTGKQAPIDHDHVSGFVRGIVVEKINWLLDEFHKGSYGSLQPPSVMVSYHNAPPAQIVCENLKFYGDYNGPIGLQAPHA